MPPPYHLNGFDFLTKEDVYKLNITKLKTICLEYNKNKLYAQKIHNVNKKYSNDNFTELADLFWEKLEKCVEEKCVEEKCVEEKCVEEKCVEEMCIEDILNMYEYEEGTPTGTPPKIRFANLTPTPALDSKNTIFFKFNESSIDKKIKVNLTHCQENDEESCINENNFGPEELLKLVNTDDFCIKIANSLKKLYKEKEQNYKRMKKHTISDSEIINTAFLTKTKTLAKLAAEKHNEFDNPDKKINCVRERLIKAITNEKYGIISINNTQIKEKLCSQLFILSKGHLPFINTFSNLVFDTMKLAKTYAYVFKNTGVLLGGEVIITSAKDMIETKDIKSVSILMKGLENVIECNQNDKNFEPVTKIVNFLNKYLGMSVIIVTGSETEIGKYFFTDTKDMYSNNELFDIFLQEINKKLEKDIFTEKIALYIYTLIVNINKKIFINQNDIINLSTNFLFLYYNDMKYKWSKKDQKTNILIVNQTFNNFLINKGYNLKIN